MAVRSDVLGILTGSTLAGPVTVVATCPAGERWIVKSHRIRTTTLAAPTMNVGMRRAGVVYVLDQVQTPTQNLLYTFDGRFLVLAAGDDLIIQTNTAAVVQYFAAGARLVT